MWFASGAGYVLDATETGELLPIAKIPYAVGSEAKQETAEPHASPEAESCMRAELHVHLRD